MSRHQIRILAGGIIVALALTVLFLLMNRTALVIAGYLISLLGVIEFFGSFFYIAGSSKGTYLTMAAFPFAVTGHVIVSFIFSAVMVILEYFQVYTMQVGWFVLIHIIFAVFPVLRLLAMGAGQEEIENTDRKIQEKTASWNSMRDSAETLRQRSTGACLKDISEVCDAFRYATSVTSSALSSLDEKIKENLDLLGTFVDAGDAESISRHCLILKRQIKEREEKAKLLK